MLLDVEFCDINHPAIAFFGASCPICEKWSWPVATTRSPSTRGYAADLRNALRAKYVEELITKVVGK